MQEPTNIDNDHHQTGNETDGPRFGRSICTTAAANNSGLFYNPQSIVHVCCMTVSCV